MKNPLPVIFILICFSIVAQAQIPMHRFIQYKSEVYKYDSAYYANYREKIKEKYYHSIYRGDWLNEFLDDVIARQKNMDRWGQVYKNWQEANSYYTELTKLLLKDKWKPENTVEIERDAFSNAHMRESGKIYLNVGLIADASNEAELAATLGHEAGHYFKDHGSKKFIKYKETIDRKEYNWIYGAELLTQNKKLIKKYYEHSRETEAEADNYSIDLLTASKFRMERNTNFFKKNMEITKKYEIEKDFVRYEYFHTHPPNADRIAMAEKAAKKIDTTGRRDFLLDKNKFLTLKQQATDECLYLMFRDLDFEAAMELCYKQLMFNPNDEFYLFFMNEALRRFLYMHPEKEDAFFITDKYKFYEKFIPKNNLPKVCNSTLCDKKKNVDYARLINYNYEFLLFKNDKEEIASLPSNPLTKNDTLEFITYKEAFHYFMARQESLKQESVGFVKKLATITNSVASFNSPYPDIQVYNEYLASYPEDTSEMYTIIPLKIDYEDNTISFWGINQNSHTDRSAFFENVVKSLQSEIKPPYKMIDYSKFDFEDRKKLYDYLTALQQFGLSLHDVETYYKNNKNTMFNYDIYRSSPYCVSVINPEIIPFFKAHKLNKVIFVNLDVSEYTDTSVGVNVGGGIIPVSALSGSKKILTFSGYYFDMGKKIFTHKFYWKKGGKATDMVNSTAHEIYVFGKQMIRDIGFNRTSTEIK